MSTLRVVKVRQRFEAPTVPDVASEARSEVEKLLRTGGLTSGSRVGITAGSRGLRGAVEVYRGAASALKDAGHEPFLFSAMGSHGRGIAQGQRDLLLSLGVSEEEVGVPIYCSDEVVKLCETEPPLSRLPVYVAREAAEADAVLVVNRVKPHTSFRGPYESGIMKMLAVGMGRTPGASMVHRLGWDKMADSVVAIGSAVLESLSVLGALALVENAREQTAIVKGLKSSEICERETRLLRTAWNFMPSLPVQAIDLCVVKEMGKNFSGTGMDTNIIGRLKLQGMAEPEAPRIKYLATLDMSEESHGNATGVGLADFATERLVEKIDREATYLNCLTSGGPMRAAVPMNFPTDKAVFEAALEALKPDDIEDVRAVIVENTLHLEEAWISENLVDELEERTEIIGSASDIEFDAAGCIFINE